MTHGNMGLWDKIVGNCRQYQGDMRMQWREPMVNEVDPIAGQQDSNQSRVSPAHSALRDLSVRSWKRGRRI